MERPPADVADLRAALDAALEEALRPHRSGAEPLGVLFSGGVDSALLAWELRSRAQLRLCTLGSEGTSDLDAGRRGAAQLAVPWERWDVGEAELADTEVRFADELNGLAPVSRTVLLALAVVIDRATPSRLLCGQGADELFLGYAHYRGLSPGRATERSREDLERLRSTDWPRTERIAEKAGKTLFAPYLSPAFEAAALRIPVELRLPGDLPKRFFREWARERGVPSELAFRPKKAVQYGTGISALLRARHRAGR